MQHSKHTNELLLIITLVVLLVTALAQYTIGLRTDDFDGDEYAYAVSADRDFATYFFKDSMVYRPQLGWQFGPIFYATRWFADGEGQGDDYPWRLVWTRIPSILAGLLLILITWKACRRFWPDYPHMAVLACAFLAFHVESLRYMRWGMHIFSEYFLLMTCLYFLCLSLLGGSVSRGQRVAMAVLSILIPLIYFPTLPALFTAVFLVFVFRLLSGEESAKRVWLSQLKMLAPFALAIVAFGIAAISEPWDQSARPTLLPWYFPTSDYAQTLIGAIEFAVKRSARMFGTLVLVDTGLPFAANVALSMGALALATLAATRTIWAVATRLLTRSFSITDDVRLMNPTHSYRLFTVAYIGIICGGTLLLSFLGKYPYGYIRYTLYLVVPVLMLAGYGLSDVFVLLRIPRRFSMKSRLLLGRAGLALLIIVGAVRALDVQEQHQHYRPVNERLREMLRSSSDSFTLYGSSTKRFYTVYAPDALNGAIPMGYTKQNKKGDMFEPDDALISKLGEQALEGGTVTVAYWGKGLPSQNHPQYTSVLEDNGWRLNELVARADRITHLGIARYRHDPSTDPRSPTLGVSVLEPIGNEELYLRGWLANHTELDEVLLQVDGEVSNRLNYPALRQGFRTLPDEYKRDWCRFETRIPIQSELMKLKLIARGINGEIAELEYKWVQETK